MLINATKMFLCLQETKKGWNWIIALRQRIKDLRIMNTCLKQGIPSLPGIAGYE